MAPTVSNQSASTVLHASPTDRAMIALDKRSAVTHHLVTRFIGDLDEALIGTVWRGLGGRHPVLRSTLSPTDQVWQPADRELGFAVLRADDAAAEHDVVQALCASRLGNDPVEPGRLTFIRRNHDEAVLVLSLHHAVVDGRGTFVLLDDLRTGYALARCDALVRPSADQSIRTIGGGVEAAGLDGRTRAEILRAAAHRWSAVAPSSHWEPRGDGAPNELPGVHVARFAPNPFDQLGSIRRARRWTVTDVILGAIARAWEEAIGRDHSGVRNSGWLVTADVRPRLGLTRGVGNLSGTEPVELLGMGAGWPEDSIAIAAAALATVRHGYPGVGADLAATTLRDVGAEVPLWLNRALLRYGTERSRYTRAIANFGPIPTPLLDWATAKMVDLWWAPPLADPPYVNATFTSMPGTLTLSLRTHPGGLTAGQASDLASAFLETLEDLRLRH
jgi:hypothetical protein